MTATRSRHTRSPWPGLRSLARRVGRLSLLATLGLAVAGCGDFIKSEQPPTRGYAADEVPFQFRIGWLPGQVTLANSQQADFALFLRNAQPQQGDRILISAAGPFATERQTEIATLFFDRGLTNVDFANNATDPELSTVTVLRRVTLPLACTTGLTSQGPGGYRQLPPGCATELTLLNQVENQSDLTIPRTMGPPSGTAEAAAYRNWLEERAQPTPIIDADDDFVPQ